MQHHTLTGWRYGDHVVAAGSFGCLQFAEGAEPHWTNSRVKWSKFLADKSQRPKVYTNQWAPYLSLEVWHDRLLSYLFHIRVHWLLDAVRVSCILLHVLHVLTWLYVSIWHCYFNISFMIFNAIILSSSINGCGQRRAFVAGQYEMFTSWQNVAFLLCFTEMNTNPTVDH